jgi:glyoxylase-like metal-dependent hydrolase (beta-lactamase superfamily II)
MWFAWTDPPRRHENTKVVLYKKIFVPSCLRGVILALLVLLAMTSGGARSFQASAHAGAPVFKPGAGCCQPSGAARLKGSPSYTVDPYWPKPLPNHWLVGAVAGIAVDARDHVWITHRPSTLQPNETRSIWKAAPPVLEFDQDGTLVQAWGGPGAGYEWPQLEHGIYVDAQDHVWLGGGGEKDAQVLEFTRDGKFLMQIGHQGKGRGSNDTENLGGAATLVVDEAAHELYVADGYVNHRVIVFDANTGAYKRHWGAYGKRPDDAYFTNAGERLPGPFSGTVQNENKPSQYDPDGPPPPQFRIVHAVRIAKDGLVYVCDRTNDRLQVFRKDGTFVREVFLAKRTFGSGSVWDLAFSPDPEQAFMAVIDGTNQQVYVLRRESLETVATFGGGGHWAGQFYGAHNIAADSHGNLFITETYEGKRIQKFLYRVAATEGQLAPSPEPLPRQPLRTGDYSERGLTPSDFPRVKKLADNVYTFEQIDPTKRIVTVNNLIVITSDGVLIADGQGTPDNTRRLVAEIARLTPQPIKYVVVGSEHGDHTGGNAAFPSGVTFFAHPFSAPRVKQPTEAVADKKVLQLGGTEIQILFLGRAHTGGDLQVFLPKEKILFMSEVFINRIFPSMANGYPSEWVATLKKSEALDPIWYVPAHGFVDAAAVLKEEERNYRLAIEKIIEEGTRLHAAKTPAENAAAAARLEPYDGWTRAANNATSALQRVYMEIDGALSGR